MKEKRAFTDESIQDTLPSEELNITERHPLDLTSTIHARTNSGLFMDPAISENLSKISASIHDARRESRQAEFVEDYVKWDQYKDLENYKLQLALETKAKAYAEDISNRFYLGVHDALSKAYYNNTDRKTVLDNKMQEMQDLVTDLNKNGFYYPAASLQDSYQKFYQSNLGPALDSDLAMLNIKTSNILNADFFGQASIKYKEGSLNTWVGADELGKNATLKAMFVSNLLHDKDEQTDNNALYNTGYQMSISAIKEAWKRGKMTSEQAIQQLAIIASLGAKKIKGYARLGSADEELYRQDPKGFEEKYGIKVKNLTPEELMKTEEGRFILENGHFNAYANEDATITLAEREWNVYITDATMKEAMNTILSIESKGSGISGALRRDNWFESWGFSGDEADLTNKYLNAASSEDLIKSYLTEFLPAYLWDIENGTSQQVDKANQDLLRAFNLVFPTKAAIETGKYVTANGLLDKIDKQETITKMELYFDEIENKYSHGPIPDYIPELDFGDGPLIGFNGNIPVDVLRSLEKVGNEQDVQAFKRLYLKKYVESVKKVLANMRTDNGAGVLKHDSNYNEMCARNKNLANIITTTRNDGTFAANGQNIDILTQNVRELSRYTKEQGFDTNMHIKQLVEDASEAYKEKETTQGKEAYAYAFSRVISNLNTAEVLSPDTFANLKDADKEFFDRVAMYAALPENSKYVGLIQENVADKGRPTKISDKRLSAMKLTHASNSSDFEQSVESVLEEAKVPMKYRGAYRMLAIEMAIASNREIGEFDFNDFKSVVNSNFKQGIYLKGSWMNKRDGEDGKNSVASTVDYVEKYNNKRRETRFETNENGEMYVRYKNSGRITAKDQRGVDQTLVITNRIAGKNTPEEALFIKGVMGSTAGLTARWTSNITGDIDRVRDLEKYNKSTNMLWDPENVNILATLYLGEMNKKSNQEEFMALYKEQGRTLSKNLDSKLGESAKIVDLLLGDSYLDLDKPQDALGGDNSSIVGSAFREMQTAESYTTSNREKQYLQDLEGRRSEREVAETYLKFIMTKVANKNKMPITINADRFQEAISDDGSIVGSIIVPEYGKVTSDAGPREKHPVTGKKSMHEGVDFAMNEGAPVIPLVEGTVKYTGQYGTYGNVVIIQAKGGDSFLYAHLRSVNKDLKVGDQVSRAVTIGTAGHTGTATGPCLHLERRRGSILRNGVKEDFKKGKWAHPITGDTWDEYQKLREKYKNKKEVKAEREENINKLANFAVKASKDMGYNTATLQDAVFIYNNLLDRYKPTKEDIASVGRTLGLDLQAKDKVNVFASLVARLAQAGDIFEKTNVWDARKVAMASIYPGTTFRFVTPDNEITAQGMSLNDIISLRKKNGLRDYTYGEWEIENESSKLTAWLKKRGIKNA